MEEDEMALMLINVFTLLQSTYYKKYVFFLKTVLALNRNRNTSSG